MARKREKRIPLTSIVIPTFNNPKYLGWTLDSIHKNTKIPYEIIIVNNSDKPLDINYGCTIINNGKNLGWIRALNQGIKKAKGDYICFLNDDVIVTPNWLTKMKAHFKGDVGMVGPTSNFISGRQKVSLNVDGVDEEKVNYLIGLCMLFKKKVIDDVGEFDERFGMGGSEEIDYCIRVKQAGYRMVIARDVFISHFGSKTLTRLPEFQKNQRDYYRKRQAILKNKWGEKMFNWTLARQLCPKIVIALPTRGEVSHRFLLYIHSMQTPPNSTLLCAPRNIIHIARNKLVEEALGYGAEYIAFIDDDQLPNTDTLLKLLSWNKDIVGTVVYKRVSPFTPCTFIGQNKQGRWIPVDRRHMGLIEVDAVGMGFMLIKMDVFKKLKHPWFYFTRYGEDFNFCTDAKKAGYKIYVDTDQIIPHIGFPTTVNEETFVNYHKKLNTKTYEPIPKSV